MVYFDNAATSFPKPREVIDAVTATLRDKGGNPGRGGHQLALAANRIVCDAREAVAEFFGIKDSSRVIFTSSATESLNLAIKGLLRPGDHVVTTSMEHNAVVRPLKAMEERGVSVTCVQAAPDGGVDPARIEAAMRPNTKLVVTTHASNVTGTLLPIADIAAIARRHGARHLVDAAQTAGIVPIDVEGMGIDLLACPGHKGLLGPQGTGVLCIAEGISLEPLKHGGTGGYSEMEVQPDVLPERYESGTLNTPGIAGLGAGVRYLLGVGVDRVRGHEQALVGRLLDGLRRIPAVRVYGPHDPERSAGVVSINITGMDPAEVGALLDEEHGILVRTGLHCAPLAHRTIGTFPTGTVRLAPGYFNTAAEVDQVVESLGAIVKGRNACNHAVIS